MTETFLLPSGVVFLWAKRLVTIYDKHGEVRAKEKDMLFDVISEMATYAIFNENRITDDIFNGWIGKLARACRVYSDVRDPPAYADENLLQVIKAMEAWPKSRSKNKKNK